MLAPDGHEARGAAGSAGADASKLDPAERQMRALSYYLKLGWPLYPLHSVVERTGADGKVALGCTCGSADCPKPGKHPRTKRGKDDATLDPELIEMWVDQWPISNWSTVTGPRSGLLVVDIDGERGEASVAKLGESWHNLPATAWARSGGGGRHLYYRAPSGIKTSSSRLMPCLDIRAEGGSIILPPSRHISGNFYTWEAWPHRTRLQVAPAWIPQLAQQIELTKRKQAYRDERDKIARERRGDPIERIERKAMEVAGLAANCGHRNASLNRASFIAFRIAREDGVPDSVVETRMLAAAVACGLTRVEALPTIRSARRGAYSKA